jgi:hypothetical protein
MFGNLANSLSGFSGSSSRSRSRTTPENARRASEAFRLSGPRRGKRPVQRPPSNNRPVEGGKPPAQLFDREVEMEKLSPRTPEQIAQQERRAALSPEERRAEMESAKGLNPYGRSTTDKPRLQTLGPGSGGMASLGERMIGGAKPPRGKNPINRPPPGSLQERLQNDRRNPPRPAPPGMKWVTGPMHGRRGAADWRLVPSGSKDRDPSMSAGGINPSQQMGAAGNSLGSLQTTLDQVMAGGQQQMMQQPFNQLRGMLNQPPTPTRDQMQQQASNPAMPQMGQQPPQQPQQQPQQSQQPKQPQQQQPPVQQQQPQQPPKPQMEAPAKQETDEEKKRRLAGTSASAI